MDKLVVRGLKTLARVRMFGAEAIVSDMGQPRLGRLANELPGYISFMREVLDETIKEQQMSKHGTKRKPHKGK